MLLSNQVERFFDHRYLWKESINILDFWHVDSHQGKVTDETIAFWLDMPGVPLFQSDRRSL